MKLIWQPYIEYFNGQYCTCWTVDLITLFVRVCVLNNKIVKVTTLGDGVHTSDSVYKNWPREKNVDQFVSVYHPTEPQGLK